jgi:hypothetical protein
LRCRPIESAQILEVFRGDVIGLTCQYSPHTFQRDQRESDRLPAADAALPAAGESADAERGSASTPSVAARRSSMTCKTS